MGVLDTTAVTVSDMIKKEYALCAVSPAYFMMKYCYIQHPQRGKIKFRLYPFQEEVLDQLRDNNYNIILKSRQLGISTLISGFSLWLMTFHDDKNILAIATKQTVAKNLVTKVRVMHKYLPTWLRKVAVEDNKLSLKFKNGSQIIASSSSGDAGRSEALSMLIMDEVAFIRNSNTIWTSAQQTLATGGRAILLSTPNGVGNFFHQVWEKATSEAESIWHAIRLHWTVHPERDEKWRKEQTEALGEQEAAQECDCSFISSGNTVVEGAKLDEYEKKHVVDPIFKDATDGNYWYWSKPDYSREYVVVADVARGDGTDNSSFHVFDIESKKQVAEYKGKKGTTDFGHMLVSVGTEWNSAILVIENTGIGWSVVQIVIDRKYPNLYYTYKDKGYTDVDQALQKVYDLAGNENKVPGFSTSSRTRPQVINGIQNIFRRDTVIIQSSRTLSESKVFIWNGQKAEAKPGYNDDLMIPAGIFEYLINGPLRVALEGAKVQISTLKSLTSYIKGGKTAGMVNPKNTSGNPYELKDPHGDTWDMRELL
jgi:hypothetical protein